LKESKPFHKFRDGTADIGTWVAHINDGKCRSASHCSANLERDTVPRKLVGESRLAGEVRFIQEE
jgi:hypothetical protein